jgi:uncharacterized membrane protein
VIKQLSLGILSVFYIVAGVLHFIRPKMYLKIMPPYLPEPLLLVYLSGVAESLLGVLLLIPTLRPWAAWVIILLLVAVFPANVFMYQQGGKIFHTPPWVLLIRLPLQGLLIAWAYWHTFNDGIEVFKR